MKKDELTHTPQLYKHSISKSGLLFNQVERKTICKYNGTWGWKIPDYVPSIIIKYNSLKIQKELIRVLRVRQMVKWLSNHLL